MIRTIDGKINRKQQVKAILAQRPKVSPLVEALEDYNNALKTNSVIAPISCAINTLLVYRTVCKLSQEGEDAASTLIEKRESLIYKLGPRALALAYAISSVDYYGVLLLPLMGLNHTRIVNAKKHEITALVGLLGFRYWEKETFMGRSFAAWNTKMSTDMCSIYFTVFHLIPAMHSIFFANIDQMVKKPKRYKTLGTIACYKKDKDELYGFGLKYYSSASKQIKIMRMPGADLLTTRHVGDAKNRSFKKGTDVGFLRGDVQMDNNNRAKFWSNSTVGYPAWERYKNVKVEDVAAGTVHAFKAYKRK